MGPTLNESRPVCSEPMAQTPSKAVLITGCSSGIGRATRAATGARAAGRCTRARADRSRSPTWRDAGCRTLTLDVTDAESMRAAVAQVEREQGAVGVLINNAGYSQSGPVEQVEMEAVRRQFETNVFGVVALTQLVLPKMREQRWGKIVNVGSMGGRLTFPGGGFYHATKHALEAISDALRFEVRGFGIDTILIEPGLIVTEFGERRRGEHGRRRRRRPLRRVQREADEVDDGHLQGSDAPPRRRPGRGREGDREGDLAQAPAGARAGDALGAAGDRPAPPHARPRVGRGDAHAVSAAALGPSHP